MILDRIEHMERKVTEEDRTKVTPGETNLATQERDEEMRKESIY